MDQILDKAYTVTSNLFGPESGIPWWAWMAVLIAVFWKVLIPEQKTAQQRAAERDEQMLAELFAGEGGKKGKKKKK
ncbi:hypothetical protein [Paractinoplanes durhamensis]|uniref:Uncharacterized protein n=1 Tax=Paractinoplanes durhamensis TaxID=113563 RepID=A0ABQ3ZBQ3_9ACTN|nr:hypothetical protein [Actinoplanes durhamensis]GIE07245.1 hypothetical protein Adu01nite_85950 [Actinoplanes durhamensis]